MNREQANQLANAANAISEKLVGETGAELAEATGKLSINLSAEPPARHANRRPSIKRPSSRILAKLQ